MNIVVFYSRINYIGVWRNGRSGAEHCYKLDLKEIRVGFVTFITYLLSLRLKSVIICQICNFQFFAY